MIGSVGARGALLAALASLIVGASLSPGAADEAGFTDPADLTKPSAFDIVGMVQGHASDRLVTHTLRTKDKFDLGEFSGPGKYAAIVIDTDGDLTSAERVIYAFHLGQLSAVMLDQDGNEYQATFRRTKPRVVQFTFDKYALGSLVDGAYRWFAITKRYHVKDFAPNRKWLSHEVTGPNLEVTRYIGIPPTSDIPVSFEATDPAGLGNWVVRYHAWGNNTWLDAATGSGDGPQTASVPATPGEFYEVCVRVDDALGNATDAPESYWMRLPLDDSDPSLTYSPGWSVTESSGFYEGAAHTTSEVGAWVEFTSPGPGYFSLVQDAGYAGDARLTFNGTDYWTQSMGVPADRTPTEVSSYSDVGWWIDPPVTFRYELLSGSMSVDGIQGVWQPEATTRPCTNTPTSSRPDVRSPVPGFGGVLRDLVQSLQSDIRPRAHD